MQRTSVSFSAFVLGLSLSLTGCGGSTSSSTSTSPTPVTLAGISVTPSVVTMNLGGTAQQLAVTGTYSDGTSRALQSPVSWNSSNTSVASVSTSGVVSALSVGSTNITASYQSFTAVVQIAVVTPTPLTLVPKGSASLTTSEAGRNTLVVNVQSSSGAPVAGATVNWTASSGWLFEASAVSDSSGNASVVWIAGPAPSATIVANASQNGSTGSLAFSSSIAQITTNTSAIYFEYILPQGVSADGFRNTITPITDPPSTYYAAILFDGGYTGMQRSGSLFDRQLQFSVGDDPTGGQAQVIDAGVSTCVRYSGEGTGWACASSYNWVIGNKYTFTVTYVNGNNTTDYTASMTDVANNVTVNLGTLRMQRIANQHGVLYSFIEQFSLFNKSCLQTSQRKNRTTGAYRQSGNWLPYASGFIAYSNAIGNCDNMDYGVENGETFISTGGVDVGDVPSGGFYVALPK